MKSSMKIKKQTQPKNYPSLRRCDAVAMATMIEIDVHLQGNEMY